METNTAGRFVWRELITPAGAASAPFYAGLFGWGASTMDMGGSPYTVYTHGGEQVAGMMAPRMPGVPPFWLDYITVEDVDASRGQVVALGGTALTEAMDIPNIGRVAIVQDPAGGTFALFRGVNPGSTPDRVPPEHTFCWSQLMSTHLDRVVSFYSSVFGWEPQPMGEMVVFHRNGRAVASAMAAQMGMPSHWLPYVAVADTKVSAAMAESGGAKTYVPPTTMPGMGEFSVHADPGGAVFALWKDLSAQ